MSIGERREAKGRAESSSVLVEGGSESVIIPAMELGWSVGIGIIDGWELLSTTALVVLG